MTHEQEESNHKHKNVLAVRKSGIVFSNYNYNQSLKP